jgi:hypothetical protein
MDTACSKQGKKINAFSTFIGEPKGRNNKEDLEVCGRILKCVLNR